MYYLVNLQLASERPFCPHCFLRNVMGQCSGSNLLSAILLVGITMRPFTKPGGNAVLERTALEPALSSKHAVAPMWPVHCTPGSTEDKCQQFWPATCTTQCHEKFGSWCECNSPGGVWHFQEGASKPGGVETVDGQWRPQDQDKQPKPVVQRGQLHQLSLASSHKRTQQKRVLSETVYKFRLSAGH